MIIADRRGFFLKRLINYRYGLTLADDTLTTLMPKAAKDGEVKGSSVDLQTMNTRFYELMNIEPANGIPTPEV